MVNTQKQFSISELSQEFGISTRTIRFYEEKGFIEPLRSGQRRIYTPADRARIRLILRGKRIGLSLAESVEIIDMYHPGESDSTQLESLLLRIGERRAALEQQRRDLDDMLSALNDVEGICREAQHKHRNEQAQKTLTA
ncbi:MerR family DNA-binding transcriptional regulator [Congregibacter brevis]|uniref:MerR family DNA-binding transcriptional regulator n=1 Tax=Congregibacter brevis TaxID=3081201 RepID=A0ABZ0IDY8_9GAMM|nr:MerR family DNA-binding transcriptional regulator [Congregibacter sp. IMCC45268]